MVDMRENRERERKEREQERDGKTEWSRCSICRAKSNLYLALT